MTVNDVMVTSLDNGLKVILKEIHHAPVASFWMWYRVGSRNEVPGITGVSHWVEHMLFKGTPTFPKGQIDRQIARHGGYMNGMTWLDWTTYFETLPADRFDLALRIEADRMVNSFFEPAEVDAERTVIISEREGHENSPAWLLGEEVQAAAFRVHPYHHEVVGHKCDLQRMTRDELWNHYRAFYAPNNAVAVAAGDFDTAALLDRIAELYAPIAPGPQLPEVRGVEPPQQGERRVTVTGPDPTAYLQMAFHVPAAGHPDFFPLVVLDTVLGGAGSMTIFGGASPNKSSRLYRALVETELATAVSANLSPTLDPFLFIFSATVRAGRPLQEVEDALWGELERIVREPIAPEELTKAIKQTRAQFVYSSETVTNQAFWLGMADVVASLDWFWGYLDSLATVTAEDVQRVAESYLSPNNRTVGWYVPQGEQGSEGARGQGSRGAEERRSGGAFLQPLQHQPDHHPGARVAAQGSSRVPLPSSLPSPLPPFSSAPQLSLPGPEDIAREAFPNDVVALARANFTSSSVVIQGLLQAGSVDEPAEKAGLAAFTAEMLARGTTSRTFAEINEQVEAVGASLWVDGGLHMTGFGARCLVEDLPLILEVLADVLQNPSFPPNEVEKVRGEIMTGLQQRDNNTRAMAELTFRALVYPEHPYGRSGDGYQHTIPEITRDDLIAFYQDYYRPQGMLMVLVGAVEPDEGLDRLHGAFRNWQPAAPRPPQDLPPARRLTSVQQQAVTLAGKTQSDLVLGCAGLARKDPDYLPTSLANLVLGGFGMMGRLGDNVRDEMGLAYYVFSRLEAGLGPGPWAAIAGVNPQNLDRAVTAIVEEMRRLRETPVPDEELNDSKAYLIGSLPLRLETNEGVARTILDMELYDLGLDYLQRYEGLVRAITPEDVQRVAQKYLDPEAYALAIAGPGDSPKS